MNEIKQLAEFSLDPLTSLYAIGQSFLLQQNLSYMLPSFTDANLTLQIDAIFCNHVLLYCLLQISNKN